VLKVDFPRNSIAAVHCFQVDAEYIHTYLSLGLLRAYICTYVHHRESIAHAHVKVNVAETVLSTPLALGFQYRMSK
jgi:hypothetical protein